MKKIAIIGSGMAGLTAGAYLSREGFEVTIFEQYSQIGGSAGTLKKGGFAWDLGPMLVEGLASHEKLGKILKELGLDGKLNLIRDERGQSFIDFDLNSPTDYQGRYWRRERLKKMFPGNQRGLNRYFRFHNRIMKLLYFANQMDFLSGIHSLINKIRLFFTFLPIKKYDGWNSSKLMDHFFKDKDLQMIFLGILADMTVKPSEFTGFGVPTFNPEVVYDKRIPTKYRDFKFPTYQYIQNGCGELPQILCEFIESKGGVIRLNTKVTKVNFQNATITAVQTEMGKNYEADIVISSGGPFNTFFNLIGKEHLSRDFIEQIENMQYMESVLMVHLGIDFDPTPYQNKALVYYYRTNDIESTIEKMRDGYNHGGKEGFLIYILSKHSPGMAPPGKHAITIYTVVPHKLKEGDWTQQRESLADKLLIEAEKIIPGLREHTLERVIITPDDFKKRLNVQRHCFGGIAPVMNQAYLPYQINIKNFWYIGQFSQSGAGVFGTAAGGREVAKMIIKGKEFQKSEQKGEQSHQF